jgi:hypothetical protein
MTSASTICYTTYAADVAPLWFPARYIISELSYALDISDAIGGDTPISGFAAVAPAGAGELEVSAFTYSAGILTTTVNSGQPTRIYTYEFSVTCLSGSVYTWTVRQATLKTLSADTPQVAPIAGFGTPMNWTTAGPRELVVTGLIGQGSSQASALLLPAYVNVLSSCPPGTGFVLNGFTGIGSIAVQNQDPINNGTIYPPIGAQFIAAGETLDVNAPFILSSAGGQIEFATTSSATVWNAA